MVQNIVTSTDLKFKILISKMYDENKNNQICLMILNPVSNLFVPKNYNLGESIGYLVKTNRKFKIYIMMSKLLKN